MIRDTVVTLKGGRPECKGRVTVTSIVPEGRLCMVVWNDSLRYTWEREEDLIEV